MWRGRKNRNICNGACNGRNGCCSSGANHFAPQQAHVPVDAGAMAEELLFRPVSHGSGAGRTIDFEYAKVPFKVQGDKVFMVSFMDSCDLDIYLECSRLKDGRLEGYVDISDDMKECLSMQASTGVEYYFGKLDSCVSQYLYALRLFVEKGLMDSGQALGIVRGLGFDDEGADGAVSSVGRRLEESRARREMQKEGARSAKLAGDAMMGFLQAFPGQDCNDGQGMA